MNFPAIPEELRALPQWVQWRFEQANGKPPTKVPVIAGTHTRASTTNPDTWATFEDAVSQMNGHAGIGWVATEASGFVLIDLDHCRDAQTGRIAPWAEAIVHWLNSYSEISPSGTGIHIVTRGSLPAGARKRGQLEMYNRDRYFTFTGERLEGTPGEIAQADVSWLHALMSAGVFDFARNPKLEELMCGQWQGSFPSQSEADLSLCSLLAQLKLSAEEIDSAFRLSGLYREKWDSPRGHSTYGQQTIATVLQTAPAKPAPVVTEPSTPVVATVPALTSPYSEDWLAEKFSAAYGEELRYTAALGTWNVWDGARWAGDETNLAFDLARGICRAASLELDSEKAGRGRALASDRTIHAVERIARTDARHAAYLEMWDADPMLLNTRGGVIDLRTGELREHRRADYCTKITAVGPGGDCPLWRCFLERVTGGNQELQAFLQRMAGYALTGVTSEHQMFFLYGTGRNGKSVFVNTLAGILGDYSRTAAAETFLGTNGDRHPTELAYLRGARLVVASEIEAGRRWNESKLKSLVSGDRIAARFVCQNFFEYTPTFKLVIVGNHRPSLRSADPAIRARLNLVPFEVLIPESERDRALPEKLKAEWPGILSWMIQGCIEWQRTGLSAPGIVRASTDSYMEEENTISRWVEECCTLEPVYFSTVATLYDCWKEWTERRGEFTGSIKSFAQALEGVTGVKRERTAFARGFRGITVRSDGMLRRSLL